MDEPAKHEHSDPRDDDETRWSSFTHDEADRMCRLRVRYEDGLFADDDPYKLPPSLPQPSDPKSGP
jgi:hypothetical protein